MAGSRDLSRWIGQLHDSGVVTEESFSAADGSLVQAAGVATRRSVNRERTLAGLQVQPGVPRPEVEKARRTLSAAYATPESRVFKCLDAAVEMSLGVALTGDGRYLGDTLRNVRQARQLGYEVGDDARAIRLPVREIVRGGSQGVLVGLDCGGNYFHWQMEAVVRFLVSIAHVSASVPLVVPLLRPMERAALEAAGAGQRRLLELPPGVIASFDELYVPPRGVTGAARVHAFATAALHGLAAQHRSSATARRRLYVSRADARRRRLTNESETTAMLTALGFETIHAEGLSVREQICLFAEAEVVVALHGAGLVNMAFAPADALLIELQPPDLDEARIALFLNVAATLGQTSAQVVCAESPGQEGIAPSSRDISVDVTALKLFLDQQLP